MKKILFMLFIVFSLHAQVFEFSGYKVYDLKDNSLIGVYDDPGTMAFSPGFLQVEYFDESGSDYYNLYEPRSGTEAFHKKLTDHLRRDHSAVGDIIVYDDLDPNTMKCKHIIFIGEQRCWITKFPQDGDTRWTIAEIILK